MKIKTKVLCSRTINGLRNDGDCESKLHGGEGVAEEG